MNITCPSCKKVLKSNEPVPAGKVVNCPACQNNFQVPADEDGFRPKPALPAKKNPEKGIDTAKKKRPRDEDDDEDDNRQSKRRPGKTKSKSNSILILALSCSTGGLLLILILILTAFVWPGFLRSPAVAKTTESNGDALVPVVAKARGKVKILLPLKYELVVSENGETDLKFEVAPTAIITLNDKDAELSELKVGEIADVVYLKESHRNMAVVIRAFKPMVGPGVIDTTPPTQNPPPTPPSTPPATLKARIVGKWVWSVTSSDMATGTSSVVKATYEFTPDGKLNLDIDSTITISGKTQSIPSPTQKYNYKVLNDQEIETTTINGSSPGVTLRFTVTINGDDLSMANVRDADGKLMIYKKVK